MHAVHECLVGSAQTVCNALLDLRGHARGVVEDASAIIPALCNRIARLHELVIDTPQAARVLVWPSTELHSTAPEVLFEIASTLHLLTLIELHNLIVEPIISTGQPKQNACPACYIIELNMHLGRCSTAHAAGSRVGWQVPLKLCCIIHAF